MIYDTLFIIILAVIILVLVVLMFILPQWLPGQTTRFEPYATEPRPYPYNENQLPGASLDGTAGNNTNCSGFADQFTCELSDRRAWNITAGRCECKQPWWGVEGNREAFAANYLAIGIIDRNSLLNNTSVETPVSAMSFASSTAATTLPTCTQLCDQNPECGGVLYSNNKCMLIGGTPTLINNPIFDPNTDSNLYTKSLTQPIFPNRVFLYKGKLPLRYWNRGRISTSTGEVLQVIPDVLYALDFQPTNIINTSGLVGIYSTAQFNLADVSNSNEIDTNRFTMTAPNQIFIPPPTANGVSVPVYMMYVTNRQYTGPVVTSQYTIARTNPNYYWSLNN